MRIGMVVHSRSGHTLTVARKLEEQLDADGREVTLEQLEMVGPADRSATTASLKRVPGVEPYDTLVLGSPVNGRRMSAPMSSYLNQISSLEGKRVALLQTHFFPSQWGAKQTIEEMTEACTSKGATVV